MPAEAIGTQELQNPLEEAVHEAVAPHEMRVDRVEQQLRRVESHGAAPGDLHP